MGTLRLVAHLLRRIAGMPSGPGAESSFISDIASVISSSVSTSSVSQLTRGGTLYMYKYVVICYLIGSNVAHISKIADFGDLSAAHKLK